MPRRIPTWSTRWLQAKGRCVRGWWTVETEHGRGEGASLLAALLDAERTTGI